MQRPCWKTAIIAALMSLSALLSGCAAVRFAYGQAPDLAYWWLDGYADFNDLQTPRVREAVATWFRWHRSSQLPGYAQFLASLQSQVTEPVTATQVCRLYDDASGRLEPAIAHALPLAVSTVQSLTPAQFTHIERKYEKVNREFRDDYLQRDPKDRQAAAVKRTVERAETLYGSLNDAQRELIERGVSASPFDPELWFSERKLRQQEALVTLRKLVAEHASNEKTLAALHLLVDHVQRSPRELYVSYQAKLAEYNCAMAARLHNSTTAEQRQTAVNKLKRWEEDARVLAADAAK